MGGLAQAANKAAAANGANRRANGGADRAARCVMETPGKKRANGAGNDGGICTGAPFVLTPMRRVPVVKVTLAQTSDSTCAVIMIPVVIDTNVFVAGLRSGGGASRAVLRRAPGGSLQPLFGNALWMEYQDLLNRPVWGEATTADERQSVLAALAGGAQAIVTHNLRDLRGGELQLGTLRVLTPAQYTENHFRAMAATGDVQKALGVLNRLDEADAALSQH
jgi:hypothetical protein